MSPPAALALAAVLAALPAGARAAAGETAADYEVAQLKRLGAKVHLLMNPGRHRVVVGLLDDVTRQSSFYTTTVTVEESPSRSMAP